MNLAKPLLSALWRVESGLREARVNAGAGIFLRLFRFARRRRAGGARRR